MMQRRLITITAALLLLLTLLTFGALAADPALTVSDTSVAPGDTFTVTFTMPKDVKASSISLTIGFENHRFELVSAAGPYANLQPDLEGSNARGSVSIGYTDPTMEANTLVAAGTVLLSADFKVHGAEPALSKTIQVTDFLVEGDYVPSLYAMKDITPTAEELGPLSIDMEIQPVPVAEVTLDKTELTLKEGEESVLTATVKPDDADDKTVTWGSSNLSVATVTGGTVKAIAAGTATITAEAGGKTAACAVTVTEIHIHSLTAVPEKPATCTDAGYQAYWKCDGCGKLFSDAAGTAEIAAPVTIPAAGHNWGPWTVTTPASETTEGVETRTCLNDPSHTETRSIPIIGHVHSLTAVPEKPATCTDAGYQAYWKCDGCGKLFSDAAGTAEIAAPVTIPAAGHNWGPWTVVREAQPHEEGEETRVCSRCGETETRTIPQTCNGGDLGHFVSVNTYENQFADVEPGKWYAASVAKAYELGLVKGASENSYNRNGDIKISETIVLACRIHSIYVGDGETFTQVGDEKYYMPYVRYAIAHKIIGAEDYSVYNVSATRSQFAMILAHALPESELMPKAGNSVPDGAIPDVALTDPGAKEIYMLYRAGVLTGNNDIGTFTPNSKIKRSEVAAIIVRMAIPEERKSLTLG